MLKNRTELLIALKYIKGLDKYIKGFNKLTQAFDIFHTFARKQLIFAYLYIIMARFTKEQTEQKKLHAKNLYTKGFDLETIADIIGLALSTVRRWSLDEDFETARNSNFIALSELRNTILKSFIDLKDGKKPTIKPDEAAKYASAFEKLSDNNKSLSYMYECFEMLTDELSKDIQKAKSKVAKEFALTLLKKVREKTDIILTRLTKETLNEN